MRASLIAIASVQEVCPSMPGLGSEKPFLDPNLDSEVMYEGGIFQ